MLEQGRGVGGCGFGLSRDVEVGGAWSAWR